MKRFLNSIFVVAMLLSFVVACSENASSIDSHDVPAPGRTRILSVNIQRPPGIPVKVYLLGTANTRTVMLDSVIVPYAKSKNFYTLDYETQDTIITFYNVPTDGFSIIAMAQGKYEERPYASILTDEVLAEQSYWFDSAYIVNDSISVGFYGNTADIQLNVNAFDLALGDSICITGTFSCGVYDKAAQKSGLVQIENIPARTVFSYAKDYQLIEIVRGIRVIKDSVYWRLTSGESRIANRDAVVNVLAERNVELPAMDILDKLKNKTLDSMLFRYRRQRTSRDDYICVYGSISSDVFMDSQHNLIPRSGPGRGNPDSVAYWVTIPSIDSAFKFLYSYGDIYRYSEMEDSRVEGTAASVTAKDIIYRNVFSEDSSLAISFWMEADSKQDGEGEGHTVLVAGDDTLGLVIAQCEKESRFICATVIDRLDSASGGRIPLGKVEILDGKAHHVSFVIHKKLFVIALDGVTVHESDIELPQEFYGISNVEIGDYTLTDYVQYSFGDFIRKAGEKDWTRLKAWLQAFYLLQVE